MARHPSADDTQRVTQKVPGTRHALPWVQRDLRGRVDEDVDTYAERCAGGDGAYSATTAVGELTGGA